MYIAKTTRHNAKPLSIQYVYRENLRPEMPNLRLKFFKLGSYRIRFQTKNNGVNSKNSIAPIE